MSNGISMSPGELKKYWCPMHPEVQSDDPNAICTKCGTMRLVPRDTSVHPHTPVKRKFTDFLPIIIIFLAIIIFTVVATAIHGFTLEFAMRMMMGSFFAIFGLFKIFNLKPFADAYSTYDIIAKRSRLYAFMYPFLEIMLAVLYLADIGGIYRDIFTFVLMSVSAVGVIQKLREREEIPCACLGMVFKLPMTKVTLAEDLLMAAEAFVMVIISLTK